MTVKEWRKDNGYEDSTAFQEYLEELVTDSVCPAVCEEGCEVEPDGECEHGNSSLLIRLGLI